MTTEWPWTMQDEREWRLMCAQHEAERSRRKAELRLTSGTSW